jgi:mRNA interferase MazF
MKIDKFSLYLANLNPRFGTEPGKTRPVVIIQSDLINEQHASTIVCPITTNVVKSANILRVHLSKKTSGLKKDSDILVDQIRAIDNNRLVKKIGKLNSRERDRLLSNLQILIFE